MHLIQVPRSQVLTEYKESKIPGPVPYVIYLKVKGTSPFVFISKLAKQLCNMLVNSYWGNEINIFR